jgi:hypothetical protein
MTVASETASGSFAWTGVETSAAPGFKAQATDHVKATFTTPAGVSSPLINGVHFAVTLDGAGNVAFLPLALPPAPGTIYVYRKTPALQQTDFANLGDFDPAVHTRLHDAAALRDAELAEAILTALTPVNGWSPVPAGVVDGSRVVLQIVAWTGGAGTPPASGQYIGATGLVAAIGDATNFRGPTGPGGGDVTGPAGGTLAMQWAFFADTTGKLLQGSAAILPLQLTASVSDYNPTGLSTALLIRLTANNPWSITGLAGGVSRRPIILINEAAPLITLAAENAGSSAANRFGFDGDVVLGQREAVFLLYDSGVSRWRRVGGALPNASVQNRHMAAASVGAAQIIDASVTAEKLGPGIAPAVNAFNFACFR